MTATKHFCARCKCELQGAAYLCVSCYAKMHKPCPDCMVRWADGSYHPRKSGRHGKPIHCQTCQDERFILLSE